MDGIRFLSFCQGWAIPFFGLSFIDGQVELITRKKILPLFTFTFHLHLLASKCNLTIFIHTHWRSGEGCDCKLLT